MDARFTGRPLLPEPAFLSPSKMRVSFLLTHGAHGSFTVPLRLTYLCLQDPLFPPNFVSKPPEDDKRMIRKMIGRGELLVDRWRAGRHPHLPFIPRTLPHGTHACKLGGRLLPRAEAGI